MAGRPSIDRGKMENLSNNSGKEKKTQLPTQRPAASGEPRGTSRRVLLVDDEEIILRGVSRFLRKAGFDVVTADSEESAFSRFSESLAGNRMSLLLLDLTLGDSGGGLELLQRIRKIDPDVAAIAVSARAEDPVMSRPQDFGFQGALVKPFTRDQMLALIAKVISVLP